MRIYLAILVSILLASCSTVDRKKEKKEKSFVDSIQIINLDSCFLNLTHSDTLLDMNEFCIKYDSIEFCSPYTPKEKIEKKINKNLKVDWLDVPEGEYILIFYQNETKIGTVGRDIMDFSSTINDVIFRQKKFLLKKRKENDNIWYIVIGCVED